jgi:hypothetical protein
VEPQLETPTTASADPFAERLLSGEKVIWRGRPRQGFMLTSRDTFLIPISLVWCGFIIFWESNVLRIPNAPTFMVLFGGVFFLVGLYLTVGRFFVDAWIRAGILYALTDRRILILRSRPSVKFQSVSLDRLPEATLNETSQGRGSIRFGPALQMWNSRSMGGIGSWTPSLDPTPQFLAIDDVKKVFARVQALAAPLK